LRWDRVDLADGTLDYTIGRIGKKLVISEPKTKRSRRAVPTVVAMLRKHKATAELIR
jgi:integrase